MHANLAAKMVVLPEPAPGGLAEYLHDAVYFSDTKSRQDVLDFAWTFGSVAWRPLLVTLGANQDNRWARVKS